MAKLKFFMLILIVLLLIAPVSAENENEPNFFARIWDFIKSIFSSETKELVEEQDKETKDSEIVEKEVNEDIRDSGEEKIAPEEDIEEQKTEEIVEVDQDTDKVQQECEDECSFSDLRCKGNGFYICKEKSGCMKKILVRDCGSGYSCDNILPVCSNPDKPIKFKVFGSTLIGGKVEGESFTLTYRGFNDECVVDTIYEDLVIARCEEVFT